MCVLRFALAFAPARVVTLFAVLCIVNVISVDTKR